MRHPLFSGVDVSESFSTGTWTKILPNTCVGCSSQSPRISGGDPRHRRPGPRRCSGRIPRSGHHKRRQGDRYPLPGGAMAKLSLKVFFFVFPTISPRLAIKSALSQNVGRTMYILLLRNYRSRGTLQPPGIFRGIPCYYSWMAKGYPVPQPLPSPRLFLIGVRL